MKIIYSNKMMSSVLALLISIMILTKTSTAHDYFEPGTIHFPLRNIYKSINLDTFVASEQNISVGKCDQVSDQHVVLNLPNLGILPPPNPYPGFIDSVLVNCINLASNEIYQVVPGSFDLVPNLNYLDLSKNRIQFCDFFNFGGPHPNLVTLIIDNNKGPMDNIDKIISKADCFPKLRYLYLRQNSIRNLNFSLKRAFPILTHLFLSDNGLDTHNFIRDLPPTLTHLYLERNLISGLDCKITRDVQHLHLDGNIIRSICYRKCESTSLRLEGVHKLITLTASQNKIVEIESCAFRDARELITLNLAQNYLDELKYETFEPLTSLTHLNLDDNNLKVVPNLCKNNLLTILSLKRNKLQIIKRNHFKNIKELKYLYLGGNQIKSIEAGSLENLESLLEFDLSNNELDFIPSDWLKWQWNLRTLDVRGNHFKSLEQMSLASAPYLCNVYMQNNPVTHISGSIVSKLSPNVVIHLQNDCSNFKYVKSECYINCDHHEVKTKNETYSRWINNL